MKQKQKQKKRLLAFCPQGQASKASKAGFRGLRAFARSMQNCTVLPASRQPVPFCMVPAHCFSRKKSPAKLAGA